MAGKKSDRHNSQFYQKTPFGERQTDYTTIHWEGQTSDKVISVDSFIESIHTTSDDGRTRGHGRRWSQQGPR
jgi:hypothetical protein